MSENEKANAAYSFGLLREYLQGGATELTEDEHTSNMVLCRLSLNELLKERGL